MASTYCEEEWKEWHQKNVAACNRENILSLLWSGRSYKVEEWREQTEISDKQPWAMTSQNDFKGIIFKTKQMEFLCGLQSIKKQHRFL